MTIKQGHDEVGDIQWGCFQFPFIESIDHTWASLGI